MRKMITVAAVLAAAVGTTLAMSAGPASASASRLNYEVDDGVSWTLSTGPSSLSAAVQSSSYADAGVVADIGLADSFTGITATGTGPLQINVWIGDDAQAYTSGTHLLSDGVDFSYGFTNSAGSYWMASGPYVGQTLTSADIQANFVGDEVYAWVGVVYTGSDVTGVVNTINGASTSHRGVGVTDKDGVLTAYVK